MMKKKVSNKGKTKYIDILKILYRHLKDYMTTKRTISGIYMPNVNK